MLYIAFELEFYVKVNSLGHQWKVDSNHFLCVIFRLSANSASPFFSCDGFGAIPHRRSINIIICGRSVVAAVSRKRGLRLSVLFRTMNVGCRSIPPFNRAWMSSISDNTGDLLSLWSHSVLISLSLKIERRHTYNLLKSEKLRKTLRRSWKWTTIEKTWSW